MSVIHDYTYVAGMLVSLSCVQFSTAILESNRSVHAHPLVQSHALHHFRLLTCLFVLQSTNFDLEFVHINCQSLAASVRDEASGWVQALSQCMRELDTQSLQVCAHLYTMPSLTPFLMVHDTLAPHPSAAPSLYLSPKVSAFP